jgi:uncharacterized protein HemX
VLIADLSAALQLAGLAATFLTVLGIAVAGFFVSQSKARDVANETAATWKSNAEAERAERTRLEERVKANAEELAALRRDAPDLKTIADRLSTMDSRIERQTENEQRVAETIARVHQSLELIVRSLGERRSEYRGPIPLDPLTDPQAQPAEEGDRR